MPDYLKASSRMPLYAKTWAMLTSGDALIPRRQQARQPVDAELGAAAGDDLLGYDVGAARLDRDVEVLGS